MKRSRKIYFLMVAATIFWSGAFISGKLGINKFSPLMLTFLRFLTATLIIFPIMKEKEEENWKISKENLKEILPLGIIGMIGYHLLFFGALKYTSATKASMINAINPLITAVLASFFVNEKLSGKKIILIITAFSGVVLTIIDWDIMKILDMSFNRGDVLMLLATSCWAVYSILVKKTLKNYTPLKLTTYTFVSCVIMLFPFAIKEIIFDGALNVGIKPYLAVLYMGIFPTVIGYTIQQASIKEIGAGKSSLFINLVPVFSTIMAVVFLHETVKPVNIISGIVIIVSVVIYSRINVK